MSMARTRTAGRGWLIACGLVVFAIALAFRLTTLELYGPGGPWVAALTLADAEMGRNLVEGRGWTANATLIDRATAAQEGQPRMVDLQDLLPVDDEDPAKRTSVGTAHSPGYSVWFAVSYLLGGEYRYIHSQRMQAVADAVAAVLVMLIGRLAWSLPAGVVGGLAYALSPPHAFLSNLTVAAATDSVWFLLVAYGAMRVCTAGTDAWRRWRGAGVVALGAFGGACMNSTALVLPTVAASLALVASLTDRRHLRGAAALLAAQVLVVVALTPWAFRNQEMYGQFSLVRGSFWQLAFAAWGELPNPWGLGFDDKEYWHWIDENCPGCSGGDQQAAMRDFLVREVVPTAPFPRHLANLIALRIPRTLEVAETPGGVMQPGPEGEALGRWFRAWDQGLPWLVVASVLGIGLALARSPQPAAVLVGLGPTVFLTLFSLVFYVELRKTAPGYGFMLAFVGVGPVLLLGTVASRARQVTVAATAVVTLLAAGSATVRAGQTTAGGELHTIVVNEDGQVWGWGNNLYGQLGDGLMPERYGALDAVLAEVGDIEVVAAGSSHSTGVDHAGRVWAWGDNSWGQLGDGTRERRDGPVRAAGLARVRRVAAGYVHTLALDREGAVWSWGNGLYGQLGVAGLREALAPVRVSLPRPAVAVAAGWFFSLALDDNGQVWAWGRNDRGQLGDGTFDDRDSPLPVSGLEGVTGIAAGHQHALALAPVGVVAWGANDYGQAGVPKGLIEGTRVFTMGDLADLRSGNERPDASQHRRRHSVIRPTHVHGVSSAAVLAAAADASLALTDNGTVWAWGDNLYGQLGDGTYTTRAEPGQIVGLPPALSIGAGHAHAVAVSEAGEVWTWGFGHYGQLGDGTTMRRRAVPGRVNSVRLRQPIVAVEPTKDYPIDIGRIDWLDPTFTVVRDGVVDIKGVAGEGQRQTYTAVAASVDAGPNRTYKVFYARGTVRRGGVTVGVLVDTRWAFSQAIPVPGPFTVVWQPPDDITAAAVLANFLTGDDLNIDVEIQSWGWLTSADAIEGMGAR